MKLQSIRNNKADLIGRIVWIIISLAATLFVLLFVVLGAGNKATTIQTGQFHFPAWEIEDGLHSLDGEWEFYWKRFLTAADFQGEKQLKPDRLARVPENWNEYQVGDQTLGEAGYATYRLTVHGAEAGQRLTLKINPLSSAYRFYVGDKLLFSNGEAGTEVNRFVTGMKPVTVD